MATPGLMLMFADTIDKDPGRMLYIDREISSVSGLMLIIKELNTISSGQMSMLNTSYEIEAVLVVLAFSLPEKELMTMTPAT